LYSINGVRQFRKITDLARKKNVAIIHTFFEKSEVIGVLVRLMAGLPVWITARRDLGFKRKRIYTEFFKFAGSQCNKCVANCEAIKEQMVANEKVAADKIDVIYNGLDLTPFGSVANYTLRNELNIPEHTQLVGMIANMYHEIKGHRYFLEAAKIILEVREDVEFVLVGDGWLRKSYETMARDLGIAEKVHFLGTRSNIPPIISNFAVSVLCSTSEGFSNVILESMASAKPVVATAVGGNAEMVIEGVTGHIIPPADSSALASSVLSILNSPSKAQAMGKFARDEVVKRFSVQAMVSGYEKLYCRLLER
jgi:glycosyltransferase involved in cell wall biosynthesis